MSENVKPHKWVLKGVRQGDSLSEWANCQCSCIAGGHLSPSSSNYSGSNLNYINKRESESRKRLQRLQKALVLYVSKDLCLKLQKKADRISMITSPIAKANGVFLQ